MNNEFKFEMVGNVLIVQVPCGNMPPKKCEEYMQNLLTEYFLPNKEAFGVEKILLLAKRT